MKINYFMLATALLTVTACKPTKVTPVSERLQKLWSAQTVTENSTTVYVKGAASNARPGYTNFRLDLSSLSTVSLTDFDGVRMSGQWSVSADEKTLSLTALNPQPTSTSGNNLILYTISSLSDNSVTLTRSTTSPKTGGTLNEYRLTNP